MIKKTIRIISICACALFIILTSGSNHAGANYLYYPTALDAVEADFYNTMYSEISTRQNAYYNNNGLYYQGLRMHSVIPAIGSPTPADMLTQKPEDQDYNWLDFWPGITTTKDYTVEIHTHNNNQGQGYSVRIIAYDGSTYYNRKITIGTGGQETPWQQGR